VVRRLVDVHPEVPVPVGHHLRRVDDRHDFQPGDVRAVDLALADVESESRATVVVGRAVVEGRVAGADQIARARLDVAALQAPGHAASSFGPRSAILKRAVPRGAFVESRPVDLYEYQGKELFRRFGIPVSDGRLATTPDEA